MDVQEEELDGSLKGSQPLIKKKKRLILPFIRSVCGHNDSKRTWFADFIVCLLRICPWIGVELKKSRALFIRNFCQSLTGSPERGLKNARAH